MCVVYSDCRIRVVSPNMMQSDVLSSLVLHEDILTGVTEANNNKSKIVCGIVVRR